MPILGIAMQGEDEDDDAILIDSYFLPGGILDPEYPSQENERETKHEDLQLNTMQLIPGTTAATAEVSAASGTETAMATATGTDGDPPRHTIAKTFPTFSPVINPNNPWATAATGGAAAATGVATLAHMATATASAAAPPAPSATTTTLLSVGATTAARTTQQLQQQRTLASDPVPISMTADLTDDFFLSSSPPTRQLRLPNLMDPQLQRMQGLPMAVPPGFEFTRKHVLSSPALAPDTRLSIPAGEEESIQGVPRELLQESMQGQDFDEGSCTSSLSHSTVPSDDEVEDDDPLLDGVNSEGAVDPRADSQPELRYSPDETHQAKDPETPNASLEGHPRSQPDDDDGPDDVAATLQHRVDQLETQHEFELVDESPASPESSVKSACHTADTAADMEPISPSSDRAIPENQATSPTKAKARKRRGHKKSRSSQDPKRIASETSLAQVDLPILTRELDERVPLAQERSSSLSGQTPEAKGDKAIPTHNLIVFSFLRRLSLIFTSFMVSMYQAAVAEVMVDNLALASYIFFRYSPLISERMVAELCLPHWTSHFISCIAVWILCSPPEGIKDRALSFLPLIRIGYVLGVLLDGFSEQQPSVMRLPPSVRMQLVFVILAIRRGYWNSHFLGLSLGLQILLSDLPGDLLLLLIGLASLNYKRQLELKTAVMIASKTD